MVPKFKIMQGKLQTSGDKCELAHMHKCIPVEIVSDQKEQPASQGQFETLESACNRIVMRQNLHVCRTYQYRFPIEHFGKLYSWSQVRKNVYTSTQLALVHWKNKLTYECVSYIINKIPLQGKVLL